MKNRFEIFPSHFYGAYHQHKKLNNYFAGNIVNWTVSLRAMYRNVIDAHVRFSWEMWFVANCFNPLWRRKAFHLAPLL